MTRKTATKKPAATKPRPATRKVGAFTVKGKPDPVIARRPIPPGECSVEPFLPAAETGPEEKIMAHIRGYMRVAYDRFPVGTNSQVDCALQHLVDVCYHLSNHVQETKAKEAA